MARVVANVLLPCFFLRTVSTTTTPTRGRGLWSDGGRLRPIQMQAMVIDDPLELMKGSVGSFGCV